MEDEFCLEVIAGICDLDPIIFRKKHKKHNNNNNNNITNPAKLFNEKWKMYDWVQYLQDE